MKFTRLKIWTLCLAVAASAAVVKLAMMAGAYLTVTISLIFLGPLGGIALDRYRGGGGVTGGVIAGVISGFAIGTFMEIYVVHQFPARPFSRSGWITLSIGFILLETFCGWHWGRTYRGLRLSIATQAAADPMGNRI